MLEFIAELGSSNSKSLLIKLPKSLLDDIEILADGTVTTATLIKVLSRYYAHEAAEEEITAIERIELYDAVFSPDRAVAEKPVNRKV